MKFAFTATTLVALVATLAACQRIAHDRSRDSGTATIVTPKAEVKAVPAVKRRFTAVNKDGTCSRALITDLGLQMKWRKKKIKVVAKQFKLLHEQPEAILREKLAQEITASYADLANNVRPFQEDFGPFRCINPETGKVEDTEHLDANYNIQTREVLKLADTLAALDEKFASKVKEDETKRSTQGATQPSQEK